MWTPISLQNLCATAAAILMLGGSTSAGAGDASSAKLRNLAETGRATQSSTAYGGAAARAIDGNTSGDYWHSSISHTRITDRLAWWEVALAGDSTIESIVIWNRTDCCQRRLTNFRLRILDAARAEVYSRQLFPDGSTFPETTVAGYRIELPEPIKGRFVRLELVDGPGPAPRVLALAEVEVLGHGPAGAPSEGAVRLMGRVVDQRGDPIHRATVSADLDLRAVAPAKMELGERPPAASLTGADGRFLLRDVEPGKLKVTVKAKGYQQQMRRGIELAAGAELELEFVLAAGAVVEGKVTTAEGEPVAGVWVGVLEPRDGFDADDRPSAGGKTEGDGRYRLAGAPVGPAVIRVFVGHHWRLVKRVEVRPGTNRFDLVLERGFEVTGKVLAADGSPIDGARVWLHQPGFRSAGSPRVESAAGGAFGFSGVRAGSYQVSGSREGYAPARSATFEVATDVGGLRLELNRGAILKGRVLGLEPGELSALKLEAGHRELSAHQEGVHVAGAYTFDNLAPGRWYVQAWVAGSARAAQVGVEVPEGVAEIERDIEVGAGFTLTGIVVDGGEPVAGARVSATTSPGGAAQTTTDADGRFRLAKLGYGCCQIVVETPTGIRHPVYYALYTNHDLRIEVSAGALSGFVRHAASGEPVAGAVVAIDLLPVGADPYRSWLKSFSYRTKCDIRGYFEIPRVRPGSWRAVATRAGYGPAEATFAVTRGSASEIELRMTPTAGVSFEVVLESGAALSKVLVALLDPTSSRRLADGSFPVIDGKVRVSTVPVGRWQLVVQGGRSASTRFAVTSPGDQGRLVLRRPGELRVRVPALERVPEARFVLTDPDGQPFVPAIDSYSIEPGEWPMHGGDSAVRGLTPGVWTFTVEHDGRTWSGQATVRPGETTEVSLP